MPANKLKPAERNTLWDHAYSELRQALLAGHFAPGHRILLRDVAAELRISLTPVRDAVNRLIAEHVLERGASGQGGGAIVPRIRAEQFDELVLIRSDLEGRATLRAAAFATVEEIDGLDALLAQMRSLISKRRLESYLALHRKFHFQLYALSRMHILEQLIENTWLRCGPVLNYVIPDYVLQLKGTDLHAEILKAMRCRDAKAAADAIRRDITEAGRYISTLARDDGFIAPP